MSADRFTALLARIALGEPGDFIVVADGPVRARACTMHALTPPAGVGSSDTTSTEGWREDAHTAQVPTEARVNSHLKALKPVLKDAGSQTAFASVAANGQSPLTSAVTQAFALSQLPVKTVRIENEGASSPPPPGAEFRSRGSARAQTLTTDVLPGHRATPGSSGP